VIPDIAGQTILVMGASGFGRQIGEAAHRPALYARLAGVAADSIVSPEIAARVVLAEDLHDRVYVNQVESKSMLEAAKALESLLDCPVCAGSLHKKEYHVL